MALWKAGQSGNPKGRPPGMRTKLATSIYKEFASHALEVAQEVSRRALAGDIEAARLVLRYAPPPKEEPAPFPLPEPPKTVADVITASEEIMASAGAGLLTPTEAKILQGLATAHHDLLANVEVDARLRALEERAGIESPARETPPENPTTLQ